MIVISCAKKGLISKLDWIEWIAYNATSDGSALVAFPGAGGFGRFAKAALPPSVYFVTNLNDSEPGFFRSLFDPACSEIKIV